MGKPGRRTELEGSSRLLCSTSLSAATMGGADEISAAATDQEKRKALALLKEGDLLLKYMTRKPKKPAHTRYVRAER